jgi:hypothetical protein
MMSISTIASCINDKLEPLNMQMKAGICELTGKKYWSVVGTIHEEAVKYFKIFFKNFLLL